MWCPDTVHVQYMKGRGSIELVPGWIYALVCGAVSERKPALSVTSCILVEIAMTIAACSSLIQESESRASSMRPEALRADEIRLDLIHPQVSEPE